LPPLHCSAPKLEKENLLATHQEGVNAIPTVWREGAEVQVKGFGVCSAFVCHQFVLDKIVNALMGESRLATVLQVEHGRGGGFIAQPRFQG
jgi:hypothetical protein